MKVKREMPMSDALEEISTAVQRMKGDGSARVNGHEIALDDQVTLEIETESGKKNAELEFEIKWSAGKAKRKKGGGRRRLLLAVTGVALAAGAIAVARRRTRGGEDEEHEV
jgi:hypothetical protein